MSPIIAPQRSPINWGEPFGDRYAIREVVDLTEVPASSIHHYRRLGLVPEPQRMSGNRSCYDDRHVTALRIIRALRRRGCTLEEIRDVVPALLHQGELPCESVDRLDVEALVSDRSPEAKLIDAAIDAFGEQSFREVSITALCERAGVAKGTFYRWFDSKETLFLATARAAVERAIAGFSDDAPTTDPRDLPTALSRHLGRALPVLLELAKRMTQESGPTVGAAVALFADLARRLGRITNEHGDDAQVEQSGGLLIMLAVVRRFEELMRSEIGGGENA